MKFVEFVSIFENFGLTLSYLLLVGEEKHFSGANEERGQGLVRLSRASLAWFSPEVSKDHNGRATPFFSSLPSWCINRVYFVCQAQL